MVLRKDKVNKLGECPIYFRIIKDRKVSYIASKIKVKEYQWDDSKKTVKKNHPNSKQINNQLLSLSAEYYDKSLELETKERTISSTSIKSNIKGKSYPSIFQFAEEIIKSYRSKGNIGTADKCSSIVKKLKSYYGEKDLLMNMIHSDFLFKYENYLRLDLKNKTNTINKDFKFIKTLYSKAYEQDLIPIELNPFKKYKFTTDKPSRDFLLESEILQIEAFPATPNTRLELHRDMFIFACYAGGLRVSDVLKLKWKDFNGTHLNVVTKKTKEQLILKVPNKSLNILMKYQMKDSQPEDFIFPIFPNTLDIHDPIMLDLQTSRANAYINKNLKIICSKVGITKKVSFHTSRHTFACLALTKGIPLDHVSRLMAHSNIKQTQTYAKLINSALDNSMDSFN